MILCIFQELPAVESSEISSKCVCIQRKMIQIKYFSNQPINQSEEKLKCHLILTKLS